MDNNLRFGAVIVAGGSSSRMQGIDKQGLRIGGVPVLVRSILPFTRLPQIAEIVIVCRADMMAQVQAWTEEFQLGKISAIVCGGSSRQQSVKNGVAALSEVDYIAIHDGARPFADEALILRCMENAVSYGAATAAVPSKDTIKVADDGGFISATPERSKLWLTQTPQIFRRESYLSAMKQAEIDGVDCTDDCQLVERMGEKVFLSQGSYFNIKITTPEDIPFAEAIVGAMEG